MSIDADFSASLSLSLGKLSASIDTLNRRDALREQHRLSAFPRQIGFFNQMTSLIPSNGFVDLDGPRSGRYWEIRLLGVTALSGSAFTALPSSAGVQASNTFAGAASGSVALAAGASLTGFDINFQSGTSVSGVVTVTNALGGTLSYAITVPAGGGTFSQTFNPPLPPLTAGSQITVNVPAMVGGPAYSISVNGVTTTAAPVVTFSAGQIAGALAPGVLPPGQARWQFTTVPSWENFSADQLLLHFGEKLIVGATGIPAGLSITPVAVINDIPVDRGTAVAIGA